MKISQLFALLCLLLAPALAAQDINALLDEAAAVKPGDAEAWISARGRILALGEDALPALAQAATAENWTAEGWVRAMAAEACRQRIANAEIASVVDSPRGIDPEHYRLFRKPAPMPQREIVRLGKEAVPLLLERIRWTIDGQDYSEGEAGQAERNALALALLYAPGFHEDTRARFALESALRDPALADAWRQEAAVSYGKTAGRDAIKTLGEIVDSATQPIAVREAAAWAFGRIPDADAFKELEARLNNKELTDGPHGERIVAALLNGVGILGNRLAWQSRGTMLQATGDVVRHDCARLLVDALKNHANQARFINDHLRGVALEASLGWLQKLAEEGATEEIRQAAQSCVEPLKLTLSRFE